MTILLTANVTSYTDAIELFKELTMFGLLVELSNQKSF